MYAEEEILTWNCKKNNWEIKYFPEIQVWHENHGSSQLSGMAYRQYCDKKILDMNQVIKAHKAQLFFLQFHVKISSSAYIKVNGKNNSSFF